eukprot:Skav206991  [mRNA]  locus=scaffold2010:123904:124488:- [translate_table: standard]
MYGALCAALSRVGLWRKALALLEELQEKRLQPNEWVYGAVVRSCKLQGRWLEAIEILANAPVTVRLSSELMNVCAQASQWQVACWALADLESLDLEADVVAKNSAMSACARGFAWPAALHMLQELAMPGEVSYTSVINACGKGFEWSLALDLLRQMQSSSIATSQISRNAVISACGRRFPYWVRAAMSLASVLP